MKNYFILILFIGLLSGCKKDMMPEKESGVITSESIANLKTWYNSQKSTQTNLSGSVFTASVGVIDWSNARFNVGEKTYIVPVTIPEQKKCFVFLTANAASDGNIISGKYVFINTDESQYKLLTASPIDLNLLEGKVIPNNFSGAIIEQDMQHKYLGSKTFLNGNSLDLKKEMMVYKLKEFNNNEPTPDNAPQEANCIDWYWQTWVNGNLESEVYWFTTCTGGSGGSGGGGGGGVSTCAAEAMAFLNQNITLPNGPLNEYTFSNDGTNWIKMYDWKIFTAGPWALISYEKATLQKITYPNNYTRWEFQSVEHVGVTEAGMNVGGTRTHSELPPIYNITPTGLSVYVTIYFTVTSAAICQNPIVPSVVAPYNANTILRSPSPAPIIVGSQD